MKSIRILLADDHAILRDGIRSLLEKDSQLKVIGEAGDGRAAIEMVRKLKPDIVLMDVAMPLLNGLEATAQITQSNPDSKVIILSMYDYESYIRQALAAATDREAYHDAWGWGDSQVAYSFIPSNSWGIGWGDEGYFSTLGDINMLDWDLGGWPDACAYCGECVDNDKMATDLIKMWESELGISIGTTSISHDQLSAPIVGQDYGGVQK